METHHRNIRHRDNFFDDTYIGSSACKAAKNPGRPNHRLSKRSTRPRKAVGYITPLEFAQEEAEEEPPTQCWASGRATPSLRPSIDLLYNLEHIINPSRLTKALAQFG